MSGLKGSAIQKRSIDVYGITGEFTVLKNADSNPVKVRYFQTVASNRADDASGNALDLLKELKPMRERVSTEDLKDLRSLLQRDLSDHRVANDLVPYLQGKSSTVGFFPSILVALMPKGFLSGIQKVSYPAPKNGEKKTVTLYPPYWEVENYEMDNKILSLAKLSVDPSTSDLIVLDGQHRANAFRYLAGAFDEATDESSIYSVFYQECGAPNPDSFRAELPVTIVWFEGNGDISPSLISRKLFVDVNTNAKKVSESRNILLNDNDLAAICATSFYSLLAEHGYSCNDLSLIHGGFDCDGKFPNDFPSMSLFSPKTIHYMLSYLLLSLDKYTFLDHSINSDHYGNFGSYLGRAKDLCKGLTDDLVLKIAAGDSTALSAVDGLLRASVSEKVYRVMSDFILFYPHLKACQTLDTKISNEGTAEVMSAWKKVFKGGEGLYNAFKLSDGKDRLSGRLKTYKTAVDQIDAQFLAIRDANLPGYDDALRTACSQAGLTGLFMALESCFKADGWNNDLIIKFTSAINKFSVENWITILTTYKSNIVPENSPKLWPSMKRIYLRFIEERSDWKFFSKDNLEDYHPDYVYCRTLAFSDLRSFKRLSPEVRPADELVKGWVDSAIESLKKTLSSVGVDLTSEEALRQKLNDALANDIKSIPELEDPN